MKKKSIKINMLLNGVNSIVNAFFPIISFPYASKILGVDNIGRYYFINSVISYFILIAGLGINTYAIREGSKIKNNNKEFEQFCKQIFTINFISTIISLLLLLIFVIFIDKLRSNSSLLFILSLQILSPFIGVEWLYYINEDFTFLTIRNIIIKIVSLVSILIFVNNKTHIYIYGLIMSLSVVFTNIINYLFSKKYLIISFTRKIKLKNHLKSIIIMFAMSLSVTIYVSSDTTLLGFICNDRIVGVYTVSSKIYTIVKMVLFSVISVSIPKLSFLFNSDEDLFKHLCNDIYKSIFTLIFPVIFGIIMMRKEIIILASDSSYLRAMSSLAILTIALLFSTGSFFWGQCVLIPTNNENKLLFVTIMSAVINIIFNILLIPLFEENAAAFTTLVSELITFIFCYKYGSYYYRPIGIIKNIIKTLIGCIIILAVVYYMKLLISGIIIRCVMSVVISSFVYFIIQYI